MQTPTDTALSTLELDADLLRVPARQERLLLVLAGLFVLINHLALTLVRDRPLTALWPVGAWILCAGIGHIGLNTRLPQRDPVLFPLTLFLTGWGLSLVARLVPSYTVRQTLWLAVGTAALLIIIALPRDLHWLRRYRYTWLIAGVVLLVITILIGQNPANRGPRLWLWLGFGRVYYQPSELLKILLVAFLASYFADHQRYLRDDSIQIGPWRVPSPAFLAPVLLMWGVCMVVLVWQRDLGAATLFFAVFMLMLYLASGQTLLWIGGLGLLLLSSVAAYQLFDVVALRVDIWWNPWPTAGADSYQVVQSLMSISAGGIFGQGIGQGYPTIVPLAHSDFAFAALAEEWGLLGVIAVVLALATLVARGMRIAVRARQTFRALLAAGLSLMIGVQSLLIMGGVLKLVPLTGVTLPYVSYGGSSLLTGFVIIGLLLVLSSEDQVEL